MRDTERSDAPDNTGSSGAPAGQPDSTNVWSRASYVGVWHMNELVYDRRGGKISQVSCKSGDWIEL